MAGAGCASRGARQACRRELQKALRISDPPLKPAAGREIRMGLRRARHLAGDDHLTLGTDRPA